MSAMRLTLVVELAPPLDEHLGLSSAVEPLTVQQLVAQLAVEAFDKAVLPRTTPRNDVDQSKVVTICEVKMSLRRSTPTRNRKTLGNS